MKLSDGERLIVVMLAEVMEELKLDGETDPKLVKTLAINNDDWAIAHKYPMMFNSEGRDDEVVKETIDILWMWGIVEHSLEQLTGADAADAATWPWAKFNGFDGNHDPHYGVAHTLIHDLGEFQDFADRGLNSHSQSSLPRYRSMYEKFEGYINASAASPLSKAALEDLLN
jgi:hypothetical protein